MNEKNTTVHQRAVGPILPDGSGLDYGNFGVDFKSKQRGLDMSVNGNFTALGMEQEVVVGASYSKLTTADRFTRAWETSTASPRLAAMTRAAATISARKASTARGASNPSSRWRL
ncbi:hypothetical protein G6F31_020409 [Rhizopus arrhizus]|nr:hypothetical protein G6F31_020409 [Rhizopus arrhizus]